MIHSETFLRGRSWDAFVKLLKHLLVTAVTIVIYFTGLFLPPSVCCAQAVERGAVIFDLYYGFPLFGEKFASVVTGDTNPQIIGFGPIGGRVEYLVANRIGITLTYMHKQIQVDWTGRDSIGTLADSTGKLTQNNALAGLKLHLAASNDVTDLYLDMSAGSNTRKVYVASTSDKSNSTRVKWDGIPFTMRVALGLRYYITRNIGFSAELGSGDPVLSAGISIKL